MLHFSTKYWLSKKFEKKACKTKILKQYCKLSFMKNGRLAQLVRASVLHTECHKFESCTAHHLKRRLHMQSAFFFASATFDVER